MTNRFLSVDLEFQIWLNLFHLKANTSSYDYESFGEIIHELIIHSNSVRWIFQSKNDLRKL